MAAIYGIILEGKKKNWICVWNKRFNGWKLMQIEYVGMIWGFRSVLNDVFEINRFLKFRKKSENFYMSMLKAFYGSFHPFLLRYFDLDKQNPV